ncbi:unnamed protein product (macronuclear) [Paramecium tetraurelia]|uniref:Cyclic nucleotide-binding domain-containing protein n=1 Tax=Paramecium tetraurelia TaxID=5888 RepID=A0BUN5_PARTE|nr:uncharacterized protein GSPATT00005498001 [Paramecium tetraurelia]CAK62252.1 unnamed protein product [Paramecium tetraurelia]|eukprot:XP_001429650.1 hypothetical protein (macronuclear) [Paramecium tetraurelia strain d4-2]
MEAQQKHDQFESKRSGSLEYVDIQTRMQKSAFEQIVEICLKPVLFRTSKETTLLKDSLRNIKFFQEQFTDHYEEMLEDVAENARLHIYSKDQVIIKQDTYGDTFYIIIKGEVKVLKRVVTVIGTFTTKKGKQKDKFHEELKEITTLKDGEYFGELALLERKPRGADIVAMTDCFILELDKDSFDRIMSTKAQRQFLHLLETLSCNVMLKDLSKNAIKALFMIMERKVYNYGDVIYKQGDKGDCLYFIIEGEFKMVSNVKKEFTKDGSDEIFYFEREAEVCILGKNESIGLEEFLDQEKRIWKAICQSQEGVLYKLNKIDYKRIEQRYPDIVYAIQRVRDEKRVYYNKWKQKYAYPLEAGVENQQVEQQDLKFDYQKYVEKTKDLKQIIMKDKEMNFISRDQITINDDMEIMLRYCPYFQLEDKKASPFLVNTPETIQIRRVKSANYRPISTQCLTTNEKSFEKTSKGKQRIQSKHDKIIAETQPTITANQQTTTQPEDYKQKSILISPKIVKSTQNLFSPSIVDKRKSNQKAKFNNQNDQMQSKVTTFMKLTPQKIEEMAIQQRLSKEEYKQKKLYINQYPFRTTKQMLNRIKSAIKFQSPICMQSYRQSQQGQVHKGTPTIIKSLSPQDSTSFGEGARIHSFKGSNQFNFDFSALPLKYSASLISSEYQKRKKQTLGNSLKFRQNSNFQSIPINL